MKTAEMAHSRIFLAIVREYNAKDDYVLGGGRRQPDAEARQMAMYMMHRELGYTLTEIGRLFSRTHATVVHAIQRIDGLLAVDKNTKQHYDNIIKELNENV